ncbi:uncharacterized protein LOC135341013 [Halichondria panicea]|uniref:uncharacterized protein LOC135341013 n=1 Tax=Halichondria panicea TaxID=6063 RepID=UPI00312B9B80
MYSLILVALALCLASASSADKVVVGFYSEQLCPDCLMLSNGPLTDAFEQVPDIFTLYYVPWGNARLMTDGKFECQHGKMECVMNTVMACVLNYYPDQMQFWPFLHCIDQYKEKQDLKKAESCASETKLDWDQINTCQSGDMGHKLELMFANVTNQLNPPHKYTPWITINGEHNNNAEGDGMVKEICSAYTGSNVPAACN